MNFAFSAVRPVLYADFTKRLKRPDEIVFCKLVAVLLQIRGVCEFHSRPMVQRKQTAARKLNLHLHHTKKKGKKKTRNHAEKIEKSLFFV
ncbi:MAG: hypothetical protein ACTFAK_11195 [Candidatus Electronema sp. VV]